MNNSIYYRIFFAEELKRLRVTRQLTQTDLAKELKVSRTTITLLENGERSPSFELLLAIADFFDISLDFILGREKFLHGKISLRNVSSDDIMTLIASIETSNKYNKALKDRLDEEIKLLDEAEKTKGTETTQNNNEDE